MVVFTLRTFHRRTWLLQRSMSMMSVTGFCFDCSRFSSRLPPFAAQLSSALFAEGTAEPSGLRRKRGCLYSGSGQLVEETREGTLSRGRHLEHLLDRTWLLEQPNTKISNVLLSNSIKAPECQSPELLGQMQFSLQRMTSENLDLEEASNGPMFCVIRDDLLHPLLGGNKIRKLDALLPLLEDCGATDVVTCGGCQSAHTAAMAFACAERGIIAHLLLRGEKPSISTGYNLVSSMYGRSIYVPRSEYADRPTMFRKYAAIVAGCSGSIIGLDELGGSLAVGPSSEKKVVVVKEGAGDAAALLGLIRLVHYLSQPAVFGKDHRLHIVVDTGTGTTAIGLALGVLLLRLPWKVTGVMLADTVEGYEAHKLQLISAFCEQHSLSLAEKLHLPVSWKKRWKPRKFGYIFPGEVRTCQSIAQQTGILLDPIYTLAGWEAATGLSLENDGEGQGRPTVVMLHTGGTLGLFGLAQRYPREFN